MSIVKTILDRSYWRYGQISGAGIDVLDVESPPANYPLLLANMSNLLVTPHNSWGTIESRQRLVEQLGKNLQAWLKGKPINQVA